MFYIVRVWEDEGVCEYTYDSKEGALAHMQETEYHAEMYVWLEGREWYYDSVN